MKKFLFVSMSLVFSFSCFAADTIKLEGNEARSLLRALQAGGAFVDCGMGTCGTEAKNVECLMSGNSVGVRHYSCKMTAQNERGEMTAMTLKNAPAKALFKDLVRAGLPSDCGMGHCGVSAKAVQCLLHGNSTGHRTYECTITP